MSRHPSNVTWADVLLLLVAIATVSAAVFSIWRVS